MFFKVIAVDFDGTLCENKWPDIGEPNHEVINYLKDQKNQGVKIVLWTCRIDDKLSDAVKWCEKHGLMFDAVNENVPEAIEMFGTDTRKIFAEEYIDDKASSRFRLPYIQGVGTPTFHLTDADIKTIETFLTKDEQVLEFKEIQALAKMRYDLYRSFMMPRFIVK